MEGTHAVTWHSGIVEAAATAAGNRDTWPPVAAYPARRERRSSADDAALRAERHARTMAATLEHIETP